MKLLSPKTPREGFNPHGTLLKQRPISAATPTSSVPNALLQIQRRDAAFRCVELLGNTHVAPALWKEVCTPDCTWVVPKGLWENGGTVELQPSGSTEKVVVSGVLAWCDKMRHHSFCARKKNDLDTWADRYAYHCVHAPTDAACALRHLILAPWVTLESKVHLHSCLTAMPAETCPATATPPTSVIPPRSSGPR